MQHGVVLGANHHSTGPRVEPLSTGAGGAVERSSVGGKGVVPAGAFHLKCHPLLVVTAVMEGSQISSTPAAKQNTATKRQAGTRAGWRDLWGAARGAARGAAGCGGWVLPMGPGSWMWWNVTGRQQECGGLGLAFDDSRATFPTAALQALAVRTARVAVQWGVGLHRSSSQETNQATTSVRIVAPHTTQRP
jgi:hypothetical protein